MINVQASTENAEAFDRLNRRLDNEVKNFTAMVKEVIASIITSIIVIATITIWRIVDTGERHGPEGGRRVKVAFTTRKTRSRRLCPEVPSHAGSRWWWKSKNPFYLIESGRSKQS